MHVSVPMSHVNSVVQLLPCGPAVPSTLILPCCSGNSSGHDNQNRAFCPSLCMAGQLLLCTANVNSRSSFALSVLSPHLDFLQNYI